MRRLLLMIFLVGTISGCMTSGRNNTDQISGEQSKIADTHNARNSLDYQGIYSGTTPCANTQVVSIMIILTEKEYVLRLTPLKEDAKTVEYKGKYTWDKGGSIITLQGVKSAYNRYFVGENHLRQLDANGKQRSGRDAENYILRKQWES